MACVKSAEGRPLHAVSAATVPLVHGAWHCRWCWERVTALLSKAGIASVAVDLPGHGDDAGPLGDLHADADRVRRVLDPPAGPVELAGHSYGGAVITDAGAHPAVARRVYLTALPLLRTRPRTSSLPVLDRAVVGGSLLRYPG